MTTVSTPTAPHPNARVRSVNLELGIIRFDWLDSDSQPVDSGNSIAPFTPGADWPDEADIVAAITASTA